MTSFIVEVLMLLVKVLAHVIGSWVDFFENVILISDLGYVVVNLSYFILVFFTLGVSKCASKPYQYILSDICPTIKRFHSITVGFFV
jgi:hypothetical protein